MGQALGEGAARLQTAILPCRATISALEAKGGVRVGDEHARHAENGGHTRQWGGDLVVCYSFITLLLFFRVIHVSQYYPLSCYRATPRRTASKPFTNLVCLTVF